QPLQHDRERAGPTSDVEDDFAGLWRNLPQQSCAPNLFPGEQADRPVVKPDGAQPTEGGCEGLVAHGVSGIACNGWFSVLHPPVTGGSSDVENTDDRRPSVSDRDEGQHDPLL